MITINRNFYIIKQSTDIIWSFSFRTDRGIIYKIFKENSWSEDYVLTKEASSNFSVILLPDDSINVLYQDLEGTIILSKHKEEQWTKQIIFTNQKNELLNIYFKTFVYKNKIQIIFSLLNKKNNISILFHQILDEKNKLSKSQMLDIIKYDYEVPFVIYSADDKDTIIMYQKFSDNHELGYKIFDKILKKWSNFNFIDSSKYPFNDYSAIIANGILHALYIKKEKDIDSVNYVNGNFTTFKINKISKCKNIKSCSIFIRHAQIWCLWIDDSQIYSIFSLDNGNHFSTSTYQQSVSSSNIFKFIYISNKPKEQKSILGNEIYFADDSDMKYLIFSDFYPYFKINKESGHHLSFIEYYMNEIHLAISSYENTSKQKEQLTTQLKYQFQEQKAQNLFYERKFKSINNAYTRFIDLKNQLNEHVTLLQESLNDKEKELALLQNLNIERDNEIQTLKDELSKNINLLQESLTGKEEKLTLLQNSNIEKDNEIQTLKFELSQNISSLQERLTNREEKLALLENFSIEKDNEIQALKLELSQNISSLQEILINKEEKLKLLENSNIKKYNEIQSLKKKLSQDEAKILYLIAKVKSLNGKIRNTYINIYKNLNMYR